MAGYPIKAILPPNITPEFGPFHRVDLGLSVGAGTSTLGFAPVSKVLALRRDFPDEGYSLPLNSSSSSLPALPFAPSRVVECADAIPWMKARGTIVGACAITSLPDVSEVSLSLEAWRAWFLMAVGLVVEAVPAESAAVFFQSDIKQDGAWIDKGALVTRAAEDAGARILFHKIIARRPPGTLTEARPGYTHLIAVSKTMKCPEILAIPDIITDPGPQPWIRAMGIRGAAHAVRFARDHVRAVSIFDPFCGVGTVLAVANALGLPALGVEKSRKRCEQARQLSVKASELD
jgi:hypothetical protein